MQSLGKKNLNFIHVFNNKYLAVKYVQFYLNNVKLQRNPKE